MLPKAQAHLLQSAVGQRLALKLLVQVVYVCTVVLAPAAIKERRCSREVQLHPWSYLSWTLHFNSSRLDITCIRFIGKGAGSRPGRWLVSTTSPSLSFQSAIANDQDQFRALAAICDWAHDLVTNYWGESECEQFYMCVHAYIFVHSAYMANVSDRQCTSQHVRARGQCKPTSGTPESAVRSWAPVHPVLVKTS